MDKKVSDSIRVLSFAFTIAIVGYHANIVIGYLYSSNVLRTVAENSWEMIANVAMSFFFMTSGVLLYNGATENTIYEKLKRRIRSIVIPFLIWNTLYFFLSVLQNGLQGGILHVLYRYSFDPYDGPLWYLFAITLLSIASPIVLKMKDRRWFFYTVIIMCIMSVVIYGFHTFTMSSDLHIASWIERLCRYFPSYSMGAFLGIKGRNVGTHFRNKLVIVCLIGIAMLIWMLAGHYLPDVLKMVVLFLAPLVIMDLTPQTFIPRTLMRNSFIIYAIHRMILTGISLIETKFNIVGGVHNSILRDGICFLFPLIVCVLVWIVADIIVRTLSRVGMNNLLKLLNGGRR